MRTQKKALVKMVSIMEEEAAACGGLKNLVVHYIGEKTPALKWAHEVIEPLLGREVEVYPVSPVVGLHVGPAVGIAYECNEPLSGKITKNASALALFG